MLIDMRALASASILVFCLSFGAPASSATSTWEQIQQEGAAAFTLYDQEALATTDAARTGLNKQRVEAFYELTWDLAGYIQEKFPMGQRENGEFAYVLFTYARYLELSNDLWSALKRYADVCELVESKLQPSGLAVPEYNGVSILRLCIRQIRRLQPAVQVLGPRPTKISILQNLGEPNLEDFSARIERKSKGNSIGSQLVRFVFSAKDDAPVYAFDAKYDKLKKAQDNTWKAAVVVSLAADRGVSVRTQRVGEISVIGLGVEEQSFQDSAAGISQVAHSYKNVFGDQIRKAPVVIVLIGTISDVDRRFITAALNDGVPIEAGYWFENEEVSALIGPNMLAETGEEYAFIDQAILYGAYVRKAVSPHPQWLNAGFLEFSGQGLFALGNFFQYFEAIRQVNPDFAVLPIYECPKSRIAVRFCLLHQGAFTRFVASLPSQMGGSRTALQDVDQFLVKEGSGLPEATAWLQVTAMDLRSTAQRFTEFLSGASWANSPAGDSVRRSEMANLIANEFSKQKMDSKE